MISPTQSNTATPAPNKSFNAAKTTGLASDFVTFLKMLTIQARNQDPLKPLDASEYASQLAQFSMVEQQVQTNDLLSTLGQALGGWKSGQTRQVGRNGRARAISVQTCRCARDPVCQTRRGSGQGGYGYPRQRRRNH
ncbi:flagellar hook capping FlgD N-terminal domain-containing protein [Ruegeria arenilitoris]|uniref:flagellar hook capping FlgD N-terminal domain-containing protein n=1 Tax=Ruegeria arenilitoris TaxID=1173585 RepID=UPI00346495C0